MQPPATNSEAELAALAQRAVAQANAELAAQAAAQNAALADQAAALAEQVAAGQAAREAGRPVANIPGAPALPLTGLPRNARELEGLRERRDILRDLLERATNKRDELVEGLKPSEEGPAPPPSVTAGVEARIRELDARILQLEREQALTERQLAGAPPEVLAAAAQIQREREAHETVPEGEAVAMAFSMFGLGAVLTLVGGRVRGWWRRRRGVTAPAARSAPLPDDPRIERLAQAVDAIALEVERIGEGQRFVTQLLAEPRPGRERAMAGASGGEAR